MSFTVVVCPDCKQRHKVPDTASAGKKVQCTKCGAIFPVTLGDEPPEAGIQPRTQPAAPPPAKLRSQRDEEFEEDSDEGEYGTDKRQGPPRRRAPIQPKQGGSGLLIVLILGGFGLLVLVCGGGVLLLWLGSRKLAITSEPKLTKEPVLPAPGDRFAQIPKAAERRPLPKLREQPPLDKNAPLPALVLSNLKVFPEGLFMHMTVDYRFDKGGPMERTLFWAIIKTPDGKTHEQLLVPIGEKSGTIKSAILALRSNQKGPFEVSIEIQGSGMDDRGNRPKVSNTLKTDT